MNWHTSVGYRTCRTVRIQLHTDDSVRRFGQGQHDVSMSELWTRADSGLRLSLQNPPRSASVSAIEPRNGLRLDPFARYRGLGPVSLSATSERQTPLRQERPASNTTILLSCEVRYSRARPWFGRRMKPRMSVLESHQPQSLSSMSVRGTDTLFFERAFSIASIVFDYRV